MYSKIVKSDRSTNIATTNSTECFKIGTNPVLFSFIFVFSYGNFNINWKSIDVVVGIRTRAAGWYVQTDPWSYGGCNCPQCLFTQRFEVEIYLNSEIKCEATFKIWQLWQFGNAKKPFQIARWFAIKEVITTKFCPKPSLNESPQNRFSVAAAFQNMASRQELKYDKTSLQIV